MDRCVMVVESALAEIEGQVAFLESIKPEKLGQYKERIETINEKIEGIVRSLNKD